MGHRLIKISGLLLGVLLFVTGLAKTVTFGEFSSGIAREIPLPRELGMISAFLVIVAELLSGAGLFIRRFRRLSAAIAAFLLCIFVLLTFRRILDGSEFECECFGILRIQLPLIYHLGLGLVLAGVALLVVWRPHNGVTHSTSQQSRRALLVWLALCALGLLWALFSSFDSPAGAIPEEKKVELDVAFPVRVSTARRATLVKGVATSGLLRPVRMVEVVPKVNGPIIAMSGYEGKDVAEGEIVAWIDKTGYQLAFDRASHALLAAQIEYRTLSTSPFLLAMDTAQARRDLEAAREHYQRVRTAYAAGRIDGPAFFRARRDYESTRAYLSANREDVIANRSGLVQAREAYERAKMELEATEIRAPFAGRIAGWEAAVGMQAHAGRALGSLVDLSRLLIDVDIVESDAGRIRTGDSAAITCMAFPDIRLSGIVRTVSPLIDRKTHMMRTTIELCRQRGSRSHARPSLCPGMFASVLVETDRLHGRLLVPREALLVRDLRKLLFTTEEGLAKWHYVETGEENQDLIEIRSGILEGDSVIVDGHHALAHDARVCVKK